MFEESNDGSSIVTARGTVEGLVIRVDGRLEATVIEQSLKDFMSTRSKFLTGNEVSLEWVGSKPSEEVMGSIIQGVFEPYQVKVKSSRLRDAVRVIKTPLSEEKADFYEKDGMFGGLLDIQEAPASLRQAKAEAATTPTPKKNLRLAAEQSGTTTRLSVSDVQYGGDASFASDSALWDQPDSRIVYSTLRSGQRIESAHSVVIIGDVNSGAEVIAGGDIFIWGTLRGIAHAGAYDDDGGGRVIVALTLLPTQLRIGSIISRGGGVGGKLPEIARVDGENIIVEPYKARAAFQRGPRTSGN